MVSADEVWQKWANEKFGERAAPVAIEILKPSWEAAKQTIYTKGYIISDRAPASTLLEGFQKRPFNPHNWDTTYKATLEKIEKPNEAFIAETVQEKEEALTEIQNSLALLKSNKELFTDSIYQELKFQLQRSIISLKLYAIISEAKLRYQLYKQSPESAIKLRQQTELQEIVEQADKLISKLDKDIVVNGHSKKLKFYLTDIPRELFQELEGEIR